MERGISPGLLFCRQTRSSVFSHLSHKIREKQSRRRSSSVLRGFGSQEIQCVLAETSLALCQIEVASLANRIRKQERPGRLTSCYREPHPTKVPVRVEIDQNAGVACHVSGFWASTLRTKEQLTISSSSYDSTRAYMVYIASYFPSEARIMPPT